MRALLVLAALLVALNASAQPVCVTKELPRQEKFPGGGELGDDRIVLPALSGIYPPQLIYSYPPAATRVGLISWYHFIPVGPPRCSIDIWGFLSDSTRHVFKADPFCNQGPSGDGEWKQANLSRPLNVGETYAVGFFNHNNYPITIHFGITLQVCQ